MIFDSSENEAMILEVQKKNTPKSLSHQEVDFLLLMTVKVLRGFVHKAELPGFFFFKI